MTYGWFTVAAETNSGSGWTPHAPVIKAAESADEVLEHEAASLSDSGDEWIVRVYEGYGQFETVLAERRGTSEAD